MKEITQAHRIAAASNIPGDDQKAKDTRKRIINGDWDHHPAVTDAFERSMLPPVSHVGAIVPPHCTGYSFVLDPGVMHVRKDGSGYIVVDENDFVLEDDRSEGPDGPEGSIHWIARMDASEVSALRDFLNGATQESVRRIPANVMAAAAKAWASVDLTTASRDELINCIVSAIMEDRNHRSLRDAAITFRCPEGFEALSTALDMALTEKDRSRLDGALKAIIQGGIDL